MMKRNISLALLFVFITSAHAEDAGLLIVPQKKETAPRSMKENPKFTDRTIGIKCGKTDDVFSYLTEEIPSILPIFIGQTLIGDFPVQLYRSTNSGSWFFIFQDGPQSCSIGGGSESQIRMPSSFMGVKYNEQ